MILSDRSIREELAAGRIVLEPSDDSFVQPASVDVRLDRYFRVFLNHTMPVIDVKKNLEELTRLVEIDDERPFVLHPGEFVLGSTFERVALPDDLVARIEGKSSLGRLGLLIHSTAGFIDAGWDGHITLGAVERGEPADHAVPGDEDRADQLPADDHAGRRALRRRVAEVEVPGPAGADAESVLGELRRLSRARRVTSMPSWSWTRVGGDPCARSAGHSRS